MRSLIVAFLFLFMPLAEIATFIFVGREIGVGMTLLLVLASIVAGAVLLRVQGLGALRQIQAASAKGESPGRPIVHGVMIVFAAILLILPGFLSDIVGILLFIPAVRDFGWNLIRSRITIVTSRTGGGFSRRGGTAGQPPGPRVIDLEDDEFSRDRPDATDDQGRLK